MDKTSKVLTRGVAEILPDKAGLEKLMQSKKIRVYLGVDPSGSQLHLGHAVVLRKLRQLQDLGHEIILLVGDFTGMVGDPTDKSATRSKLTRQQVLENAKTYQQQASKILNFEGENPVEIKFNSQWLAKLTLEEILELSSNVTVQQLEERDMFVKRKSDGKPIYLNEFLYPLLQGYDSVVMEVDLEVGGTDQTFNMLMGRHLTKVLKNKEKYVLTVPLLLGTDGQKMSKSINNSIALEDDPSDMYGKIMSIGDLLIESYWQSLTDLPSEELTNLKPLDAKKKLAFEIVKIYHSEQDAQKAQSQFESVFQKRQMPEEAKEVKVSKSKWKIVDFLVENRLVESKSAAKRLVDQNAIEIDSQTVKDPEVELKNGQVVKIGKRKFVKIKLT